MMEDPGLSWSTDDRDALQRRAEETRAVMATVAQRRAALLSTANVALTLLTLASLATLPAFVLAAWKWAIGL